jgi:DNA-binding NarL/FixJ family response regulator
LQDGNDASVQSCIEYTQMPLLSMLIFDTHPALLGILVRYLKEQHAELLTVAGAACREADMLSLAATTCPQIVVLGVCGPMQDTIRLIDAVRRLLPSVIIVAMCQLGMAGYAQAALDAGADIFVDKDDLKRRLVPAILEAAVAQDIVPSAAATALSTRQHPEITQSLGAER